MNSLVTLVGFSQNEIRSYVSAVEAAGMQVVFACSGESRSTIEFLNRIPEGRVIVQGNSKELEAEMVSIAGFDDRQKCGRVWSTAATRFGQGSGKDFCTDLLIRGDWA